jgi:hypothetical protein
MNSSHPAPLMRLLLALHLTLLLAGSTVADEQNGNAEECTRRAAIAASLAKVESATRPAAQEAALLAQLDAVESQIIASQPIAFGACGDNLGIDTLRQRLDRARDAVRTAAAEEHRRKLDEQRRRETAAMEEQRRRVIAAKPWPDDIKRAVTDRKVQIGMTSEQVLLAWGRPEKINETIRASSREEQWIYAGSSYLYFTNGTLVTIQRTR